MRLVSIMLLSVFILFSPLARAQDKSFAEGQMVGMVNMLKFMAKAYVKSADLEKIKNKNIKKINDISDAEFKQNYALAYSYIGQSEMSAGFKDSMSKQQVINVIKSLDKAMLTKMIDEIDSAFIAGEIKKQLAMTNQDSSKFNMQAVTKVWTDITQQLK